MCGGALVTNKHVVTAAHCIDEASGRLNRVTYALIGDTTLAIAGDTKRFIIKIKKKTLYPGWTRKTKIIQNDIAVLLLDTPVSLTKYPHIKPVCLPNKERFDDAIGRQGIVTGWGAIKEDGPFHSVLQELKVYILQKKFCKSSTGSNRCAGYEKGRKDACLRDSGGPLVVKGNYLKTVYCSAFSLSQFKKK